MIDINCVRMVNNNSETAIFVVDLDLFGKSLSKYSILSIIQYCNMYKLDLVVCNQIDAKYDIPQLRSMLALQYGNNQYYSIVSPHLFMVYELFDSYSDILFMIENDMILTPSAPNYIQRHRQLQNDITIRGGIQYINYKDALSSWIGDQSNLKYNYHPYQSVSQEMLETYKLYLKLSKQLNITYPVVLQWFGTVLNHNSRELYNITKYKQFISKYKSAENIYWDRYFQYISYKELSNNQFKIGFGELQSTEQYKSKLVNISNVRLFNNDTLHGIVADSDIQLIHCCGGGRSPSTSYIRSERLEFFYKSYWRST